MHQQQHMMRHGTVRRRNSELPHLEAASRIASIPLVESGWGYAGDAYGALKRSSSLAAWGCEAAEASLALAADAALPAAVSVLGTGPICALDRLLCRSLDMLDQRVPSIYLPPQMIYWNTKQYMNSKLVAPMLKRADSMKHLGSSVLTSKYTEYAADTLDGALDVADKYVERYLPAESGVDEPETTTTTAVEGPGKAVQTIHHVDRFSRKLKRRLTRHAIAEAKALKQQSTEAIHVLIYVAELIATDPKLALAKARELWASLSRNEPENQARPATLEQLVVMLTRETARRLVHLVNHTGARVAKLPAAVGHSARGLTLHFLHVADALVKTVHLDVAKERAIVEARSHVARLRAILRLVNSFANHALERLALTLAGGGLAPACSTAAPSPPPSQPCTKRATVLATKRAAQRTAKSNNHAASARYINNVSANGGAVE